MEEHRGQRQQALADANRHQVLLRAQDEAPERGAVGALHDLDEQLVGAPRALRLALGQQEVGVVEGDRVDVGEVDERLDVDRAGLARRGRGELLVAEHDLAPVVELVAVADVLEADLLVLLRAEAPGLDRRSVLLVQLPEVQVLVAHRAEQLDGDVDEPEAQRAAPQRSRHQSCPPPERLASSAAIRSDESSGSSSSGGAISSPLAFCSITASTALRYSSS